MLCVNDYQNSMIDCVEYIQSFSVFSNGKKKDITKQDKCFDELLSFIYKVFESSRIMPAFGVSLHNETINELKNGNWLQINFNKQVEKNGLLFSSLLFKLEKTNGINLIRLFNDKYEGRCVFLDFDQEIDLKLIFNTLDIK